MKKMLLFSIPAIGIIGFSFLAKETHISKFHNDGVLTVLSSVDPPGGRTGAPGEPSCTSCHLGAAMSAEGVMDFTLSGGPNYTPGATYPITISTIGGPKNGFELTILDASNDQAGTFTSGSNTSTVAFGGKEYIRHSASVGQTAWTFEWTAPTEDIGELTAYFAMNKSNNNGSATGDEIFVGNVAIPSLFASVAENPVESAYGVYFNSITRQLNLDYAIFEDNRIVVNIQNMSGKLVQYYDLGIQPAGSHKELLTVNEIQQSGIYVVSLFVGNKVYNRKLMLE